jgi:predicted DNA-binding protein
MADNRYTSIYLGEEGRAELQALAEKNGQSMSLVVRGLVSAATNSPEARVNELVGELADLLHLR